jgi:hypothetical protein
MATESKDSPEAVPRPAFRYAELELSCPGGGAGRDPIVEPRLRMVRKPGTQRGELPFGERVHARRRCVELDRVAAHGCEVKLTPRDDLGHRPPREDAETEATKQRRRANVDAYHSKLAISPRARRPRPASASARERRDLRVEDVAREQSSSP